MQNNMYLIVALVSNGFTFSMAAMFGSVLLLGNKPFAWPW